MLDKFPLQETIPSHKYFSLELPFRKNTKKKNYINEIFCRTRTILFSYDLLFFFFFRKASWKIKGIAWIMEKLNIALTKLRNKRRTGSPWMVWSSIPWREQRMVNIWRIPRGWTPSVAAFADKCDPWRAGVGGEISVKSNKCITKSAFSQLGPYVITFEIHGAKYSKLLCTCFVSFPCVSLTKEEGGEFLEIRWDRGRSTFQYPTVSTMVSFKIFIIQTYLRYLSLGQR